MLLSLGLSARSLSDATPDFLSIKMKPVIDECRLALFIVHNFLSHLSDHKYHEVVRTVSGTVNLGSLVREMLELYEPQAQRKGTSFETVGLDALPPTIRGHELEIRRAIHNVLNNALKYSYHSVGEARRTIRVRARAPYDPGFRERRLALQFENYGLGLSAEERRSALKPGFRGRQARAEVPLGSGIGLSEVAKIMKMHGGEVRIQSRELPPTRDGTATYLTAVDLIFPY
jgi:signal transduction histidine kinase